MNNTTKQNIINSLTNTNTKNDTTNINNYNSYENDSDNDQGFVPTKVQIKSDIKNNNKNNNKNDILSDRPIDFQGRYIFGDGIIRKQPCQIYNRFHKYLNDLQANKSIVNDKLNKQGNKQKQVGRQEQQNQQINIAQDKQSQHQQNTQQLHASSLSNKNNKTIRNYQSLQISKQSKQLQQQILIQKPIQKSILSIKNIQPVLHPYQKFIKSQLYTLVYSRIKQKVCNFNINNDDFASNQVNLSKVMAKYDADYYSVLKAFQYGGLVMENNKDMKNNKDNKNKQHKNKQKINNKQGNKNQQNLSNSYKPHLQQTQSTYQNASFRIRSQNNNSDHTIKNVNPIHHIPNNSHHHSNLHHHSNSHNSQTNHHTLPIQQLQFDSKFQCGNLLYAFKHKIQPHSYYLFIQNDTNSYGYNQWFYFSLRNMKINTTYKFTIVNFRKKHSLFKQGMKIAVWSYIDSCQQINQGNGWRRQGDNIKYEKSIIKKNSDKKFKFYSLSFQLKFRNQGDYIKIAMNVPYSYSRLIHHLKICQQIIKKENQENSLQNKQENQQRFQGSPRKLSTRSSRLRNHRKGSTSLNNNNSNIYTNKDKDKNQEKGLFWQMVPVGYSISNNAVPYVTITSNKNKPKQFTNTNIQQQIQKQSSNTNNQKQLEITIPQNQKAPQKKVIILLSRQHPGQTWSSFLMQQFLYALAENKNQNVKWLLDNYIFKIFPMVNVDGVIYGNFRCDIGGFDLNRNWRNPDKNLHPQIFSIKNQIQRIASQYSIQCVLDFHGHSKQYNTFSYACRNDAVSARVLSLMISQINPIFHFPYCTFGLSKYKQTTARAVVYKLTGNQNILTIQNSFFAAKVGSKLIVYDPQVMSQITKAIIQGMQEYFVKHKHRTECEIKVKQNLQQFIGYERIGQTPAVDSGSQSQPYVDQISIKDKIKKILPKSFKAIQQQLEQQQKSMQKKPSPTKKRQADKKVSSTNQNYKTLNPNVSQKNRKRTEEDQANQTFIQRTSLTHYKRNSKEITFKKETPVENVSQQSSRPSHNSIQNQNSVLKSKVGDVGLPFYLRQKSTLVPIKLKNDSLQIFKDAYNATKATNQYQSNLHKTFTKNSNKKVKILNSYKQQSNQQFPILCVLSQQKKRHSQFQKTNDIFNEKQIQKYRQKQRQKIGISLPPKVRTFVQNEKLQHLKKNNRQKNQSLLQNTHDVHPTINYSNNRHQIRTEIITERIKQKNKDATLISKIWRQNFARYGKDLNIFFGGMKG